MHIRGLRIQLAPLPIGAVLRLKPECFSPRTQRCYVEGKSHGGMLLQSVQALLVGHGLQKEDSDWRFACGSSIYRRDVAYEPQKLRVPELHFSIPPLRTSHSVRLPRPQTTIHCPLFRVLIHRLREQC